LVQTEATIISAGTELAVTKLAQASLVSKAKARPDLVKKVIEKAKTDGIGPTIASVRTRLEGDLPLGYSGAGRIIEVGDAVTHLRPGMRVATAGGGCANHAEFQAVPMLLCAQIPESVNSETAALATVAAIAMHGVRQADIEFGSKVLVVGLGLIGQLTARLAMAAGCDVAGVDVRPSAVARATESGVLALADKGGDTTKAILDWSRGRGADAVIITAGSGDSSIIKAVPARCRDRAVVVAVGVVGLDIDRADFFAKELELRLARSYGPGRYDPSYEEWGVDYPAGYVRWTEGRNLEAYIDLIASGRLHVDDLLTHRFEITDAPGAYDLAGDPAVDSVGVVLRYSDSLQTIPKSTTDRATGQPPQKAPPGDLSVGLLGAGLFARSMVLPSLRSAGFGQVRHIASRSGLSAARLAEQNGNAKSSADPHDLIEDPAISVVAIAAPHSAHADLTALALAAGKHVYVEKPLALTESELDQVLIAQEVSAGHLYVGFNRRYSPMVTEARKALGQRTSPIVVDYRVCAGPIGPGHWYADRREGGRLLGEVCHFVDTANAIVGSRPVSVVCRGFQTEQDDSVSILISYQNGSTATVNYIAETFPATAKERCEILGRGHTITIDNYRELTVDGSRVKTDSGKGHVEGLTAFRRGIQAGDWNSDSAIETTRLMFAAARSLRTGIAVDL